MVDQMVVMKAAMWAEMMDTSKVVMLVATSEMLTADHLVGWLVCW